MKSPDELRALLDAAKATKQPPTEPELDRVYRRLQAQLEEDAAGPRYLFRWSLAGAVAALVLLTIGGLALIRAPASGPAEPMPLVLVRLEGAHQPLDGGHIEAISLADGAVAELEAGSVATVALLGPAELRRKDVLEVTHGSAAFAVRQRPPGTEFSIQAGDALVVVHGTRFALAVSAGKLDGIRVTEGVVELRGPRFERGLRLNAGSQWGAPPREDVAVAHEVSHPGDSYVDVESEPAGALVFIDGVAVGRSPLVVRASAGVHLLQTQLAEYAEQRAEVLTEAGKVNHVALRLEPVTPADDEVEEPEPDEAQAAPQKLDPMRAAQKALRRGQCAEIARLGKRLTARGAHALNPLSTLLAECHLRAGRKQAALELYARLAATGGTGAEAAQFETARLLGELGRHEEALKTIEAYAARYPAGRLSVEVAFRRCEVLISLTRRSEAKVCLEQFLQNSPQSPRVSEAGFFLASIARVERRWEDCARGYDEYLHRLPAPRSEEALFQLARCRKNGGLPGAQAAVQQYLERFPRGAHAEELKKLLP